MDKSSVISRLKELKHGLLLLGISKVGLFGSTVREEATMESDVDILIDFEEGKETFGNFMSVCDILQDAFGKMKVDVVTVKGLSPFIGSQILSEVEYV